jgi:hypothetical protein
MGDVRRPTTETGTGSNAMNEGAKGSDHLLISEASEGRAAPNVVLIDHAVKKLMKIIIGHRNM